jgi:hypothetical protein
MSTWDRVKERAAELSQMEDNPAHLSSSAWNKTAEFGFALCEEIERLEKKIEAMGRKKANKE